MPPPSLVRLAVVPEPAHIGVVRLVAVSMGRLAGLDEEVLGDVRLATSEAVGRAVAAHRFHVFADAVQVELEVVPAPSGRLCLRVRDCVALPEATGRDAVELVQKATEDEQGNLRTAEAAGTAPGHRLVTADPPSMAESVSLIAAVADEASVTTGPDGTVVSIGWRRR